MRGENKKTLLFSKKTKLKEYSIDISKSIHFSLKKTVLSHGWVNLAPFKWMSEEKKLYVKFELGGGVCSGYIQTDVLAGSLLFKSDEEIPEEYIAVLNKNFLRMLALNQDINGLVELCKINNDHEYLECIKKGWGRILKAPSYWEDAVKTICTTNASWSYTQQMCRNLCSFLGEEGSFPGPEKILSVGAEFLKEKVKLGYRSEFVFQLALDIIDNNLDLDAVAKSRGACRKEAERIVKNIKGLGPYGANHMMVLLDWYSYLPIDREVMKFLNITPKPNGKCPWKTDHYKEWGDYRFIIYKLDRIRKKKNWIGA